MKLKLKRQYTQTYYFCPQFDATR